MLATLARGLNDCEDRKGRRGMQRCPSFEHFLTEVEWAAIKQPTATRAGLIGVIAPRAWLIGIECPAEPTLKRVVDRVLGEA